VVRDRLNGSSTAPPSRKDVALWCETASCQISIETLKSKSLVVIKL